MLIGKRIKPFVEKVFAFKSDPWEQQHQWCHPWSLQQCYLSTAGIDSDSDPSKPLFQTERVKMKLNPEISRKPLLQPQKEKERHKPVHPPHCPHHWQGKSSLGTGCASSLPTARGVSCSCQGGPYWTDKALKAPSPCQLGSGTVSLGVCSPTGLPARLCPGRQRKCIAFHFNKSQMMPFANYQNGAKVKNPLNYNTCHGPKLLWLTVLWEIH